MTAINILVKCWANPMINDKNDVLQLFCHNYSGFVFKIMVKLVHYGCFCKFATPHPVFPSLGTIIRHLYIWSMIKDKLVSLDNIVVAVTVVFTQVRSLYFLH